MIIIVVFNTDKWKKALMKVCWCLWNIKFINGRFIKINSEKLVLIQFIKIIKVILWWKRCCQFVWANVYVCVCCSVNLQLCYFEILEWEKDTSTMRKCNSSIYAQHFHADFLCFHKLSAKLRILDLKFWLEFSNLLVLFKENFKLFLQMENYATDYNYK